MQIVAFRVSRFRAKYSIVYAKPKQSKLYRQSVQDKQLVSCIVMIWNVEEYSALWASQDIKSLGKASDLESFVPPHTKIQFSCLRAMAIKLCDGGVSVVVELWKIF